MPQQDPTYEDAISLLDRATSGIQGTRTDHHNITQALQIIDGTVRGLREENHQLRAAGEEAASPAVDKKSPVKGGHHV